MNPLKNGFPNTVELPAGWRPTAIKQPIGSVSIRKFFDARVYVSDPNINTRFEIALKTEHI